jgi:hypothetical protein
MWEEVEHLWSKFNKSGRASLGYQLIWERAMFGGVAPDEQIRGHLRKWNRGVRGSYPTTVLVTTDPKQMAAALTMLCIEAQDYTQAHKELWNGSNGTTI